LKNLALLTAARPTPLGSQSSLEPNEARRRHMHDGLADGSAAHRARSCTRSIRVALSRTLARVAARRRGGALNALALHRRLNFLSPPLPALGQRAGRDTGRDRVVVPMNQD
jgi:hypothetical protein